MLIVKSGNASGSRYDFRILVKVDLFPDNDERFWAHMGMDGGYILADNSQEEELRAEED